MDIVVLGRNNARITTNGIATVITTNCSNTIALLNHKLYKFLTQKQYKSRGYDNDRYITTCNNLSILSSFKNNINLAYMIRVLMCVVIVVVLVKL